MSEMSLRMPSNYVDGGTTYSGAKGWAVASMFAAFGYGGACMVGQAIAAITALSLGIGGLLAAATFMPAAYIFGQLGNAGAQALWDMAIHGRFTITTNNNPFSIFSVSC